MATKTTNYNLAKPSYSENADISVINSNMDIIDSKMKEIENKAGTGGGSTVEWNQIQTTGSKIAEVTIDGTMTEVYAPSESGGGGGSGSGYSETLLFENTGKVSSGTITLSDSILNYNQIVFEVTNNNSTNWEVTSFSPYLVSVISERIGGQSENKGLFLVSVDSAWKACFLTTENSITFGEGGAYIKRIYGIKF